MQFQTVRDAQKFYTVSEVNKYIADLFAGDGELTAVSVKGEISNFTNHLASGHFYFSIKDAASKLNCVMFRNNNRLLKFMPQNGQAVIVRGYVSVYQQRGEYQLYASSIEKEGAGDLYKKYIELKEKLEKKGYFDEARKRKLPVLPRRIGIITAPEGSVVCDIINILNRRFPNMPVLLAPAYVQGKMAAPSICAAIERLNAAEDVDVIILARGGGSIEELWPFNEETVADAIYASTKPVISAVGHQTDFTISDFVSDLRAPTPSAAAELAVFSKNEMLERLCKIKERLTLNLTGALAKNRSAVILCGQKLSAGAPEKKLENLRMHLDRIEIKMRSILKERRMNARAALERCSPLGYISAFRPLLDKYSRRLTDIKKMASMAIIKRYTAAEARLDSTWLKFSVYDYKKVLQLGYSIVRSVKKPGIIKSKGDLATNDKITLKFIDGSVNAIVTGHEENSEQ